MTILPMRRLLITLFIACLALNVNAQERDKAVLRDSLSVLIRTIDRQPDNVQIRLRKASLNVLLEQYEYALEEYDRILKLDEENPTALFYRAYVHEQMHNLPLAKRDYETILKKYPRHFEANLGLALLAEKENQITEAYDRMNTLVQLFPDSALVYALRGNLELSQTQFDAALYDFDEAIDRDNTNVDYRLGKVEALLGLWEKKKAKKELDEIVSLGIIAKPQLADYYVRCRQP